jgi:hypothetical protein
VNLCALRYTGWGVDTIERRRYTVIRIHALSGSVGGMTPDALHQQSQDSLIRFLEVDLELCHTMLQTARLASHLEHYEHARGSVARSIETIRTLLGRVQDRAAWSSIHARADGIEAELRSLPPFAHDA